jgi:hypothetical protein
MLLVVDEFNRDECVGECRDIHCEFKSIVIIGKVIFTMPFFRWKTIVLHCSFFVCEFAVIFAIQAKQCNDWPLFLLLPLRPVMKISSKL